MVLYYINFPSPIYIIIHFHRYKLVDRWLMFFLPLLFLHLFIFSHSSNNKRFYMYCFHQKKTKQRYWSTTLLVEIWLIRYIKIALTLNIPLLHKNLFITHFTATFCLKCVHIMYLIGSQMSVDVFLIGKHRWLIFSVKNHVGQKNHMHLISIFKKQLILNFKIGSDRNQTHQLVLQQLENHLLLPLLESLEPQEIKIIVKWVPYR